ncbi:MAG: hypothetical protein HY282_08255 [Nitrospirae bacterium]|nr:hypothetical protein [Candidatus Manganitrophaceae bacterium]
MTTWVHFFSGAGIPAWFSMEGLWRIDWYRVQEVIPVQGESPFALRRGAELVRIETGSPVRFSGDDIAAEGLIPLHLQGVMQHLHYTGRAEREDLERVSRPEPGLSGEMITVLILVGKSEAWWKMAQDERQVLFQKTARHEGHRNIGYRYADRIYRRLYHARYVHPAAPYDFITYFEFESSHTADFRSLLSELRDIRKNPEWLYVDFECEVWMAKSPPPRAPLSEGRICSPSSCGPVG